MDSADAVVAVVNDAALVRYWLSHESVPAATVFERYSQLSVDSSRSLCPVGTRDNRSVRIPIALRREWFIES